MNCKADQPPQKAFGAAARVTLSESDLTDQQKQAIDRFCGEYVAQRTESKRQTQLHRRYLADARTVSGFRPSLKEMTFPIVVNRSKGVHLWDVDGNRYVDLTCGFGSNFLGHGPDFMIQAMTEQLQTDYSIGPQTPLAGEVARLFSEITGCERVAFANSGSEAVLGATRLARTYTGKDKIVMFHGDYHGILDEVIVRGNSKLKSFPAATGIPSQHVSNTILLEYGDPASLEFIKNHLHELAAVLVEPVQSRRPELQPREFLQELARITEPVDTALIMDEVISGLRIAPGGAQQYFGVKADIATYGKVVGGGMPIGVIAGKAKYMDGFDGGFWQYGDDSRPEAGMTYFAGTFCRHPVAMAAAKRILETIQAEGEPMYARLNSLADNMAQQLNELFQALDAPMFLANFGSLFKVQFRHESPFSELVFAHLRHRGYFIWDHRPCLLTIQHTQEHLDGFVKAFRETIILLQSQGLLSGEGYKTCGNSSEGNCPEKARPGKDKLGRPGFFVADPSNQAGSCSRSNLMIQSNTAGLSLDAIPLVIAPSPAARYPMQAAQLEVWLSSQQSDEANCAYNEIATLTLSGCLNQSALVAAIQSIYQRHGSLRATFDRQALEVVEQPATQLTIEQVDWQDQDPSQVPALHRQLINQLGSTPFDLQHGPLLRVILQHVSNSKHLLTISAHHLILDGWSLSVVVKEMGALYNQAKELSPVGATRPQLATSAAVYADYARAMQQHEASDTGQRELSYWIAQFADSVPTVDLPLSGHRSVLRTYSADRIDHVLPATLVTAARKLGAKNGCSLYNTMLAAFQAFVARLCQTDDLVLAIPTAGQAAMDFPGLVGHCVNTLPLRIHVEHVGSFKDHLKRSRSSLLSGMEHQRCSFGTLLKHLNGQRDPSRPPLCAISFNLDPVIDHTSIGFAGLEVTVQV